MPVAQTDTAVARVARTPRVDFPMFRFRRLLAAAFCLLLMLGALPATAHAQQQPFAIADLQAALQSPEAGSRYTALERLSRIGGAAEPALPAVVAALADPDPTVR